MSLIFDSIILDLLVIAFVLFCVIYDYFNNSFRYWSFRNVFNPPSNFLFGNLKDVIFEKQSHADFIKELYNKVKSNGLQFGGYYAFSSPELLVIDPDLIKAIMAKDFRYFSDRGLGLDVNEEPITGNLIFLKGLKWKIMRQKMTPTFTSGKIKIMFPTILACTKGLEEALDNYSQNQQDIDVRDVFGRFNMDIIGSCAFGLECNSFKDANPELFGAARKLTSTTKLRTVIRMLLRFAPKLFKFLKLKYIEKDVTDFFIKVVADIIEYREKNNIQRNDFLQLLINMKNTENEEGGNNLVLNLEQIVAQCLVFFVAGYETSSASTSFFFYEMCQHPEIQDKVREEINDMLERYDGELTYDGIMELQYLEMALFESLRLHPTFSLIDRRCTQDYKIPNSDVIIEKGTLVVIPFNGLHSDPEFYPEPEKYDPERFSKEETAKRHLFTFMPFGEGPRVCIGKRFSLLQLKIGIILFMKNHRFTLSKKMKLPLKMSTVTTLLYQVEGGIWIRAERI